MTITVDVSPKEFAELKGSDEKPPRGFILLKKDENNSIGDTVIVHEKDEKGALSGWEFQFEITYIILDHKGLKPDWRTCGIKIKE